MKLRCTITTVAVASLHALAAIFIEWYRVMIVLFPLAAFEVVLESITGNRTEAEYFGGRVADKAPYGIVVESAIILVIGLAFCRRRATRGRVTPVARTAHQRVER